MANQEDLKGVSEGIPAVDIPNLKQKEKEKERKKGGAVWSSGKPGGSFTGATGGNGAGAGIASGARSAASSAASRLAALAGGGGQGQAGAGVMQFLSGMSSTLGGKITLAGSAVLVAGLGMYALSVLLGGSDSAGGPNLGSLASTIKVRPAGMANPNVGRGEIKFDEDQAVAPPAVEKTQAQPETTDAQPVEAAEKTVVGGRDRLEHNLSGAKLTTDLGSNSSRGGATAAAAGAGQAASAQRVSTAMTQAQQGKLSAMRSAARAGRSTPMNLNRARSSRAIGQLKMARGMSVMGANSTAADPARSAAADAFDQGTITGGQMSDPASAGTPIGGSGGTTPVSPVGGTSGGAPDVTMPGEQPAMPGYNVTPYQSSVQSALDLGAKAGALKKKSIALIVAGAIMIAAGVALVSNPLTAIAGGILIAAGATLVTIGVALFLQAQMMAKQARQLADQIKAQYGQQYQKDIIDQCMDQALANGTDPKNCDPATRPNPHSSVQDDVRAERESGVTFEGPRVVH